MAERAPLKKRIRQKLREGGVKLWDPPYTGESGENTIPAEFVTGYSAALSLEESVVASLLEEIRAEAYQKAKAATAPAAPAAAPAEIQPATAAPTSQEEAPKSEPQATAPAATAESSAPAPEPVASAAPVAEAEVAPSSDPAPPAQEPVASVPTVTLVEPETPKVEEASAPAASEPQAQSSTDNESREQSGSHEIEAAKPSTHLDVAQSHQSAASGTDESDSETGSGKKKEKSKKGLDVSSFFKRKKDKKEKEKDKIVSFENTAFFAAQAKAAAEQANKSDDDPLYFDQLTPEQQAQWMASHTKKDEDGDEAEAPTGSTITPVSAAPVVDSSLPATAARKAEVAEENAAAAAAAADAIANDADKEDDEDGPKSEEPVVDVATKSVDLTHDPNRTVTLQEQKKKKGFFGMLRRGGAAAEETKYRGPIAPPVAPVAPARMDFKASELKMTDLERIRVMEMVKQKKWTVDEAIEIVLNKEKALKGEPAAPKPAEPAAPAPAAPVAVEAKPAEAASSSDAADVAAEGEKATDADLDAVSASAEDGGRLRHLSLSRPRVTGRRLPSRGATSPGTDGAEEAKEEAGESIKASEMQLSDLQRVEVMELVKRGELTVEQAMQKVLEAEKKLASQPATDAEGYKVPAESISFQPMSPEDSDAEKSPVKDKPISFNIKPTPFDPFASGSAPGPVSVAPAPPPAVDAEGRRLSSFFPTDADAFTSLAATTNVSPPIAEGGEPDPFAAPAAAADFAAAVTAAANTVSLEAPAEGTDA
eukprot:m.16596 g.16596  ORF g.16596 m.16596 type:complete len:765 (+) comp3156_c0_seq1:50-2344(+)